jgi:hypothetical protein
VTSLKARHDYREVLTLSEPTMPSPSTVRRVSRKVLSSGSQVASRRRAIHLTISTLAKPQT